MKPALHESTATSRQLSIYKDIVLQTGSFRNGKYRHTVGKPTSCNQTSTKLPLMYASYTVRNEASFPSKQNIFLSSEPAERRRPAK